MSSIIESLPVDGSPLSASYTYHSKLPQAPGKYILGVDEAGRGPVLGPMVYGIAYCPVAYKEQLEQMGFDDSKALTPESRSNLLQTLSSDPHNLGWSVRVLSPQDLSSGMLRRPPTNLNQQAQNATVLLIQQVLAKGLEIDEIYVDALGNTKSYQEYLSSLFPTVSSITVCAKADAKYKIVGAASVGAKVTRDAWIDGWVWEELKHRSAPDKPEGAPEGVAMKDGSLTVPWGTELGSGYPSGEYSAHFRLIPSVATFSMYLPDPNTKAWIAGAIDPVFGYPSIARFSWATVKTVLEDTKSGRAHKVTWTDDGQTIATAFQSTKPEDKGRSGFLKDLSIRSVTSL
ncbi:hypothetical protein FRC03_000128 [Tulasnella sp. 419]|nr:hypothetical protein FRC03_000128 [Tulasnella sp. 419]